MSNTDQDPREWKTGELVERLRKLTDLIDGCVEEGQSWVTPDDLAALSEAIRRLEGQSGDLDDLHEAFVCNLMVSSRLTAEATKEAHRAFWLAIGRDLEDRPPLFNWPDEKADPQPTEHPAVEHFMEALIRVADYGDHATAREEIIRAVEALTGERNP